MDSNLGETWTRASSTKGRLVPRRSPLKHTFDQTGQTGFANRSHRFRPENTQRTTRPKTKQMNSNRDETWIRELLRQRTTCLPKIFLNGHCDQNRSDLFPKPVRPVSPRQTGKQPVGQTPTSSRPISRIIHGLQRNFGISWVTSWATSTSRESTRNAHNQEESKKSPL
jgi:hypothetical protein